LPASSYDRRRAGVEGLPLGAGTDGGWVEAPGVPSGFTVLFAVEASGRWRLYSRQQAGHRHSISRSPVGVFVRVNRQPNCALMSV
jgi:hypothetical protein